jgi:TPR repeat protein
VLKDATLNEFNQLFGSERSPQSGRLWREVKEGRSNVFVYFSGHGVPDLQTRQPFLLPSDGNPSQGESGFSLDTLYRNLELVKKKVGPNRQVIVMIDACFTGETGRKGETLLAVSAPGFMPAKPTTGSGLIKLLATSAASPANWDRENKLGLFTSRFLLGAAGLARASDAKPELAWTDLRRFVIAGVTEDARRDSGREQVPEIDDAPFILKPGGPVPAVERGFGRVRDEAAWRVAEAANTTAAYENYAAHCGPICAFKDKALGAIDAKRNVGAADADTANWQKLSALQKYQDYLDGCRTVCAYRDLAEHYLGERDPNRDSRVRRCDQLAGGGFDADRPKEVRRVCLEQIDTPAAIAACREAAEAFPKLRRLQFQLGRAYDAAHQYGDAAAAYRKAVALGSAAAAGGLGALNDNGEGMAKSPAEAERLFRWGAEAGGVVAMSNLGRHLEYGVAGHKDVSEAATWYKRCADAGNPLCGTKYANMIMSHVPGVDGDGPQAVQMLRKSSDAGEMVAMTTMAVLIDSGYSAQIGVTGTALDYLKRALKRGEAGANAISMPGIFNKLKPETRIALQRYLSSAGAYSGPTDGQLSPVFIQALKRFAVEQAKTVKESDFPEAGESCSG